MRIILFLWRSLMNEANLIDANLEYALFNDVKAVGLKFSPATILQHANFDTVDFSGVDFCGINLSFCNFDHSFLHNCVLSNCTTNHETKFNEVYITKTKASCVRLKLINPQKIWECDFSKSSLRNSSFSNIQKWSGVIFKSCDLTGCIFTDCGDMKEVDFTESVLSFAKFQNCILSNRKIDLVGLDLGNAAFTNVDLSNSNLSSCHLDSATFQGCFMKGVIIKKAHTLSLWMDQNTCATLDNAVLSGCNLEGISFANASLKEADLSDCILNRADFTKANLKGVNLSRSKLDFANFSSSNLTEAILNGCTLIKSNFSAAKLNKAKCQGCQFQSSIFVGAEMEKTSCTGSNFQFADLQKINGTDAKFDNCNLICAIFVPIPDQKQLKKKNNGITSSKCAL